MTVEKIYHVETQEDHDSLMYKLESDGVTWDTLRQYKKPTESIFEGNGNFIRIRGNVIVGKVNEIACRLHYPDVPIETYKAPQVEKEDNEQLETELKQSIFSNNDKAWISIVTKGNTATAVVGTTKSVMTFDNLEFSSESSKKVTVPQFVADWIEEERKFVNDIMFSLNYSYIFGNLPVDVRHWYDKNSEKFYRAILDDYEVEQEKLYTVVVESDLGLIKNCNDGMVMLDRRYDEPIGKTWTKELTEKEIKDYDDRFWIGGFEQEVTE